MDHFPIVMAIVRPAVQRDPDGAAMHHAKRLHEALEAEVEVEQAAAIAQIIDDARRPKEDRPPVARVVQSGFVRVCKVPAQYPPEYKSIDRITDKVARDLDYAYRTMAGMRVRSPSGDGASE